jgi:cytochrome c2
MTYMRQFRVFAVCAILGAGPVLLSGAGKGDAAKGKAVFRQCAGCHNVDSRDKKVGPGLKGLFHLEKMTDGKTPTEANVRARIDNGTDRMPPYKDALSDQEKNDLIAYLETL